MISIFCFCNFAYHVRHESDHKLMLAYPQCTFAADDTGLTAAVTLQVREALMKKVSRERVGSELEGMFNGMVAAWLLCHVCILQHDYVCILQHDSNHELPIANYYPSCGCCGAIKCTS